MVLAVAEPLSALPFRGEGVLKPKAAISPWPPDLAHVAARVMALAARRAELAVERESLWSEALDLDEWRRDLIARCQGTRSRRQERLEALAAERASRPGSQQR
jgi:hypothetical protein